MRQEALGWESEGITLEKARLELARLREAKRTGVGPCWRDECIVQNQNVCLRKRHSRKPPMASP